MMKPTPVKPFDGFCVSGVVMWFGVVVVLKFSLRSFVVDHQNKQTEKRAATRGWQVDDDGQHDMWIEYV